MVQLAEKVKKLEEMVQKEREIHDNAILRERQTWEREVRILREALAPFYKSEKGMRARLMEIEDKVDANYDAQIRLSERVVAIDDATMALERRLDDLDPRPKRRRLGRATYRPTGYTSPNVHRLSSGADSLSSSSQGVTPTYSVRVEPEEARSSGILNLVTRPLPVPGIASFVVARQPSPQAEEARSSGFLALDLAARINERARDLNIDPQPIQHPLEVPFTSGSTSPDIVRPKMSPPSRSVSASPISPRGERLQHHRYQALDMLAEISMTSSLVH